MNNINDENNQYLFALENEFDDLIIDRSIIFN